MELRCSSPLTAYQDASGGIHFVERKGPDHVRQLLLRCGRCITCRLERSRQWAVRIMHEAQLHRRSQFWTLTYHPESLPPGGSLRYSDFQLFARRFRRWRGRSLRYFVCGEYGESGDRPHYHVCAFDVEFADESVIRRRAGAAELRVSDTLTRLWSHGFVSIGNLSFESAAYCARYCLGKVTGDLAAEHYRRVDPSTGEIFQVEPEFAHMSLKPGIGSGWFDRFSSDVFPAGTVVVAGREGAVPRYYRKLLKRRDAASYDDYLVKLETDAIQHREPWREDRLNAVKAIAESATSLKRRSI